MKLFMYTVVALVILFVIILVGLSVASRKQPELGLVDGQLQPCPASPNCVCSEYPKDDAYIAPLSYTGSPENVWARLKQVIVETGGEIIDAQAGYLRAVYQTPWLRFVDDVEFRLDGEQAVIHVRSASRVGRSDLGANRARVETVRAAFSQ